MESAARFERTWHLLGFADPTARGRCAAAGRRDRSGVTASCTVRCRTYCSTVGKVTDAESISAGSTSRCGPSIRICTPSAGRYESRVPSAVDDASMLSRTEEASPRSNPPAIAGISRDRAALAEDSALKPVGRGDKTLRDDGSSEL